ncbi:MAG: TatD family hydrolase [Desulfovibrio sp.]|nr:TatD family hydrolase [Desulfovibrio sp.]
MAHKKPVRIDPVSVRLPDGGVDSHAHLDSAEFDPDRTAVIARAAQAGVSRIGNVFLSPEDYHSHRSYFQDCPGVFFLLGIHPCDGLKCTPACVEEIAACFQADSRIRAVGEIGLDFHWDDCPRELQFEAFSRQLAMAKRLAAPVVIHCREAEKECLALLEAGGFAGYPLLWHCFGGDAALAKKIVRLGWHISIPGPVTYPANKSLREAIAVIPEDRLLLETDCPYLSPVPWRGTRNEPAYTVFTGRAVAEAAGQDAAELWLRCAANAVRFFGLSASD